MNERWLRSRFGQWMWPSLGLIAVASLLGAWKGIGAWRLQAELERATVEMSLGRMEAARTILVNLSARRPNWAEVEFRLGECEQAVGHQDAALAAWSRVPSGSPWSARAATRRGSVLIDAGRFAAAEEVLEAARDQGPHTLENDLALVRLYRLEGRVTEVRPLLQDCWIVSRGSPEFLKELWVLDAAPLPVGMMREALDRASADDDRVWLGRANLEIQSGRFAEAARWLDRCARVRPTDQAVWRARLELARATTDFGGIRQALGHLTDEALSEKEVASLRAAWAERTGNATAELSALTQRLALEPGDVRAVERSAELEILAGRPQAAEELRRRKGTLDQARQLYRQRLAEPNPVSHAIELARLATTLGRRFESAGWSLVADRGNKSGAAGERIEIPAPAASSVAAQRVARQVLLADLDSLPISPRTAASLFIPRFDDDATSAGLNFVFDNGRSLLRQLPETMSGGVALLDYDGDGWLDVYAVQGGPFPPPATVKTNSDRLYRNLRNGRFEDVSASSGIASCRSGYGHGVTVGDFDNDGRPDLFVTRWGGYALYRNRSDGRFEDITESAGLGGDRNWPTSAAFADLDGDGDLDLYVCHYLKWDPQRFRPCTDVRTHAYTYCDPRGLDALADHVYRNDGGRFVDVTANAGIVDRDGRGLGVVAADLDADGRVDLFIANDQSANFFFRNQGGFRFQESAQIAGLSGNAEGGFQAGMGVACGDQDGDGLPDLAVTNFFNESTTLYHNLGRGMFGDWTASAGLAAASRYQLGFGVAFADVNNDGRLDLITANGHVNDARPLFPYSMPAQLFLGTHDARLIDASDHAGPPWSTLRIGRGLAAGDLDNDGRIDVVILAQNEPLAFLHNRGDGGHFVTFRLEGTRSNRDGVGAVVTVVSGGHRQVAQRTGGGSYQSANDGRLHFGLGTATRISSVEIRWPSGQSDTFRDLATDTGYVLREGDASARPLAGFAVRGR